MEGNVFAIPLDILATIAYAEPNEVKMNQEE